MSTLKIFVVCILVMMFLDFIWLGFITKDFYLSQLGHLARTEGGQMKPNFPAMLFVYVLVILGVVFFVLPHVATSDPVWMAAAWGAVFGFLVYGIYDFTNLAILRDWPLLLSVADVAWGTVVCACVSAVGKVVRDGT